MRELLGYCLAWLGKSEKILKFSSNHRDALSSFSWICGALLFLTTTRLMANPNPRAINPLQYSMIKLVLNLCSLYTAHNSKTFLLLLFKQRTIPVLQFSNICFLCRPFLWTLYWNYCMFVPKVFIFHHYFWQGQNLSPARTLAFIVIPTCVHVFSSTCFTTTRMFPRNETHGDVDHGWFI